MLDSHVIGKTGHLRFRYGLIVLKNSLLGRKTAFSQNFLPLRRITENHVWKNAALRKVILTFCPDFPATEFFNTIGSEPPFAVTAL